MDLSTILQITSTIITALAIPGIPVILYKLVRKHFTNQAKCLIEESISPIYTWMEKTDGRLGKIEERLDRIEERLDRIEKENKENFGNIDRRLDRLNIRLDEHYKIIIDILLNQKSA